MTHIPSGFCTEERMLKAKELFHGGMNCAQAVVMAFADIIEKETGVSPEDLKRLTTGFGGGFGRLREVCGCVSGMTFLAGILAPQEGSERERNAAAYKIVQEMAAEYREKNGSIVCRELLGLGGEKESAVPSERTAEYYRKRPCEELVGIAAGIAARKIIEKGDA